MQFANPGEFADDCPATWVVKLVSHTPTNARISSNNDRRPELGKTSQFPCMSSPIPTISMPDILRWPLTRLPKALKTLAGEQSMVLIERRLELLNIRWPCRTGCRPERKPVDAGLNNLTRVFRRSSLCY